MSALALGVALGAPAAAQPPDLLCLTDLGQAWIAPGDSGAPSFGPSLFLGDTALAHDASNHQQALAGDFAPNGRTDLAMVGRGGQLLVAENLGEAFAEPVVQSAGFDFDTLNGDVVLVGDVDGDGRSDLIQIRTSGDVELALNRNGVFDPLSVVLVGQAPFDFEGGSWVGLGDHDGDGRVDLLRVSGPEGRIQWWRSSGEGFEPAREMGPSGFRMDPFRGWGIRTGDFSGNGRADLLCVTEFGEAWVMVSTGAGWESHGNWGALGFHDAPLKGRGWTILVADMDGDGRDDLLCLTEFGDVWWARSTGSAFVPPVRAAWTGFQSHPAGPFQTFVGRFR